MANDIYYMGVDLGFDRALVSIMRDPSKSEIETISTSREEERFHIPTAIYISKNGKTFYGEEAKKRAHYPEGEYFEDLYANALKEKEEVLYRNLLTKYLTRLIRLGDEYVTEKDELHLAVAVPAITGEVAALFSYVREQLGLDKNQFLLLDRAESFYAHTYHQERNIWLHDTAVFDFTGERILFLLMHRNGNGRVQRILGSTQEWTVPEAAFVGPDLLDSFFAGILKDTLNKRIISGMYFTGDGFHGDWLKESIRVIGQNKRVFIGDNLYTRGAVYAIYRKEHPDDWYFYYHCDYKMQGELAICLLHDQQEEYIPLVHAGENWFDESSDLYMLYNGTPELHFRIRTLDSYQPVKKTMSLEALPERPAKTLRLHLSCKPESGKSILIQVEDDGFGDIYPSSGKTWNERIVIGE